MRLLSVFRCSGVGWYIGDVCDIILNLVVCVCIGL